MSSFLQSLERYFAGFSDTSSGVRRICRFSKSEFLVRPEDIEFYVKIGVPLPTICPSERRRRRLATHNSYNLFRTSSAYSQKDIVSIYPPDTPYKIYEADVWHSDAWDPFEYGREYNSERTFFEQFRSLQLAVPRPALVNDPASVNSEFANSSSGLKNCYLTFDQSGGENLYYHQCCYNDTDCMESWAIDFCETCYACKFSQHLSRCFFCEKCRDCIGSWFLWDCRNCQDCFMSSGLRNKKYYFRNEYVGREEYERRMRELRTGSWSALRELIAEYRQLRTRSPRRADTNEKSVNVQGAYIRNSKNVHYSLYVEESDHIAYSEGLGMRRDSYDVFNLTDGELCYEVSNMVFAGNTSCRFSLNIDNCRSVEYCDSCSNCSDCFGCVGLKNKQYCIFNRQYEKDEYEKLIDEIKTRMLHAGEYGEFFPPENATFPYRTSILTSYPGYEDFDAAERYGYDTHPIIMKSDVVADRVVLAAELPDDIGDTPDSILKQAIHDSANHKYFRILKPELAFYRRFNLPLPREHPSVRMERWRKEFDVRLSFAATQCRKCGQEVEALTSDLKYNLYCDACYQEQLTA